jgi:hypothetical protein
MGLEQFLKAIYEGVIRNMTFYLLIILHLKRGHDCYKIMNFEINA